MIMANTNLAPSPLHPLLNQNWEKLQTALEQLTAQQLSAEFIDQLTRIAISSDFVVEQLQRKQPLLAELVSSGDLQREYQQDDYCQKLSELLSKVEDENTLHLVLRQFRQREQMRLIWRDINRLTDMRGTTRELSWMADCCIDQTLNWLHNSMTPRFGQPMATLHTGEKEPQYMVVLGMGKLGANELNLSSDIDLMFSFAHRGETEGGSKCLDNQDFFIRLGKKLIQALDNITVEGFVFRTDMRLRPFGSAGPLAISFDAMELYYQDQGREWERYAMIKARVVAGDKEAGEQLLQSLKPFVYRKYIDFGAFESLREMKEMINREVRRKGREANVKLGSGGIREVEFIAQAFQLIRGGRDSRLQQRELLNILPLLPETVGMPQQAVDDLIESYTFLRDAEHAIQALADKQTQDLPIDEQDQLRLAFSMGFNDWPSFADTLEQQREKVRQQFANVIAPPEDEQTADTAQNDCDWKQLWTDDLEDPHAIELLAAGGFNNPEDSWHQLSSLRTSKTVSMLQQIGQERLANVLPLLLNEISQVDNASETLVRVLQLVQAVLRRSAYLVLLAENPMACKQLVLLCSASPWFSEKLAKQPILLDELIDQRTLYALPDKDKINNELRQQLLRIPEDDTEQLMEALRYFKNAITLRVAASEITGALPLMKVSDYLTWAAEAILTEVLDIAWRNLTEKHGSPASKSDTHSSTNFIVLGYGKVGGIELSYGSDLDLVFIHDTDPNQFTDGAKQIANSVFFTRLGQRIIHILNTFTPSGQLYEVDMRLRPSGNSGLLVSSLKAFEDYQRKEAWTWEHQALVRARVVAGDSELQKRFEQVRSAILSTERDLVTLRTEVVEMREKMRSHLGSNNTENTENPVFHLKQDRGGIVDIEFMVQYLALAHSANDPSLIEFTDNIRILDAAESSGLLSNDDAELMREAYKAFRAMGHRLTLQEQSNVIGDNEMSDHRSDVSRIWNQVMA